MTFDLLVLGATLPDGRTNIDIAVQAGKIIAIAPNLPDDAHTTLEAHGRLVSAPFIDCHFHMDATLSLGLPRLNQSGTLLEGIALWSELKPLLTHEAVIERALRYCDLAVSRGLLAVRSHVDICDDRLLAVEALLDVKKQVAPYLDLQLVAFPQDGYLRSPTAAANLERALDLGVDVVGGIPHFERTMADGMASVTRLCEIAAERGLPIDLHCDESDDPMSRHIETLAREATRLGLGARATASHATSMHSMDNYYVSKLLPLIAESGINVIANPLINITLQGRHDNYPRRRGLTRIPELRAHGVPVALAQDCVMDPWYGLGAADLLDVAHMAVHAVPMTSREAIRWTFSAVTEIPAKVMGLESYGLNVGADADFVVLQAADPIEAVRLRAERIAVVRRGRIIARTPKRLTSLELVGRPTQLDAAHYAPRS